MNIRVNNLFELSKPNTFKSLLQIGWEYFLIFFIICITLKFFNFFTALIAIMLIGGRLHSLSAIAHDSVHYRICKNKKINDWIANIFLYYPLFSLQHKYRTRHLLHHKNNSTDEDPDYIYKKNNIEFKFPQTKIVFLKNIFKFIFGFHFLINFLDSKKSFYNKLKYFLKGATASRTLDNVTYEKNKQEIVGLVIFNVLFIAIVMYFFNIWYYILFWFLPIFLYLPFVFRIRSVCEHFGVTKFKIDNSRTMYPNWFDLVFLGFSWNLSYHLDHHLFPTVPSYNLKKLHAILLQNKDYKENAQITLNGSWGVFKECTNYDFKQ